METKFNFKSQICTSKVQSERLLALGLKRETADMYYRFYNENTYEINPTWETIWEDKKDYKKIIPAWSLHRLLSLYNLHYIEFMNEEEIESMYDIVIDAIEIAIEDGNFNEDYLV